jgi:hypothetical protein
VARVGGGGAPGGTARCGRRPELRERAPVSLNATGCAPARELGAGSTIPSLPLRRLLLTRPERELQPQGSEAASVSSSSRPSASRAGWKGPQRLQEGGAGCEDESPPTFKSWGATEPWEGGETCVAPPSPVSLPPALKEEGLRNPHLQTRPRSLGVRPGTPHPPEPPPLGG